VGGTDAEARREKIGDGRGLIAWRPGRLVSRRSAAYCCGIAGMPASVVPAAVRAAWRTQGAGLLRRHVMRDELVPAHIRGRQSSAARLRCSYSAAASEPVSARRKRPDWERGACGIRD
jgi:hypothetical protein